MKRARSSGRGDILNRLARAPRNVKVLGAGHPGAEQTCYELIGISEDFETNPFHIRMRVHGIGEIRCGIRDDKQGGAVACNRAGARCGLLRMSDDQLICDVL